MHCGDCAPALPARLFTPIAAGTGVALGRRRYTDDAVHALGHADRRGDLGIRAYEPSLGILAPPPPRLLVPARPAARRPRRVAPAHAPTPRHNAGAGGGLGPVR